MLNNEDSGIHLDRWLTWSLFALLVGLTTCGPTFFFDTIANVQGLTISSYLLMELLLQFGWKNCYIISNDCEIKKQRITPSARKHYFHGTLQKTVLQDLLTKYTQKEKIVLQTTESMDYFYNKNKNVCHATVCG